MKEFDFLTRSQIQQLHDLKGKRNANRFLKDIEEYVNTFRHGLDYVYYLNKSGMQRVDDNKLRKKTYSIHHTLMRNQLRIALKNPSTWVNEVKMSYNNVSVISDAKYIANNIPILVEVDASQTMVINRKKIEKYKKIKEMSGLAFNLIWVTELESRRNKLQELMDGLTGRVYTFRDIQ